MMRHKYARTALVALGVAVSAAISGCGASTPVDERAPANETKTAECVRAAEEGTAAAQKPVALVAPEQPAEMSRNAGKTIWLINVYSNQWTQAVTGGFEAAAKAAGMKPVIVDGKGEVPTFNRGTAQAVAQKADGIVLLGVPAAAVDEPLAKARAAGIPVVDVITGGPESPLEAGIAAHVTADFRGDGAALADWMLADSKCDVRAHLLGTQTTVVQAEIMKGVQERLSALCSWCKATTEDVDMSNIATDVGRKAQSAITRDPKLNYLLPAFDSAVTFVMPQLQQSGSDVKVLSHDGVEANLDNVRAGDGQVADMAFAPADWIGWAVVDQMGRAMLDARPEGMLIPTRLIDKKNAGASNADLFPEFVDFEKAFTGKWGL